MPSTRRKFIGNTARLAAAAATASLGGCRVQAAGVAPRAPAPLIDDTSLGGHAARHGVLYGCAVDAGALASERDYADLIRKQCRIVVAENAMKWSLLRPTATTYDFVQADALVAFAEANHIKVRGHTLAWHQQTPPWLNTEALTADARGLLVSHIETVAGRYAGRMHSWDVVNEAIEPNDGRPDGLRNTPWLKFAGDDYIELAFKTARTADPQALLSYNEFGIEADDAQSERKRQATLLLLRRMIARRIPIDALGIQSHIFAVSPPSYGKGLTTFLEAVRELGLQVFITELDVNDRAVGSDQAFRDLTVAVAYKQYLELVLADPAVTTVLTWGITDRHTWLNSIEGRGDGYPERSLPFDSACQPTASFSAIRNAFDRRPASPKH